MSENGWLPHGVYEGFDWGNEAGLSACGQGPSG